MTTPVSTSRRGGRTPTRSNLSAHPGRPVGSTRIGGTATAKTRCGMPPNRTRRLTRRCAPSTRPIPARGARSSSPVRPGIAPARPRSPSSPQPPPPASQSSSWRSAAPPQTSRTRPASRLAAPAWPASSQLPARPLHPSAVAPPPPPPPAPPPPPSAEQISPPSGGGGYRPRPRTATPQETDKPRIDVTRAPMSVAPEPRTPPKTAAPGGNSGNGGGWPW